MICVIYFVGNQSHCFDLTHLKGHQVVLEKKFWNLIDVTVVIISEENKVSRTLFEARKVAGSAIYKHVKQFVYSVIETKSLLI